jgi:hypothetical protein
MSDLFPLDLIKASSLSLTILAATILFSILASDLSPTKLLENFFQLVTVDNVIKLWKAIYHGAWLLMHKCGNVLASLWTEYILPIFHHARIKALETKLQLVQIKLRNAEKRYDQDQKLCANRSDEMKGITQLLQILQETMHELSRQQEQDCSACESRFAALQKMFEEKLLALQITLTGLCHTGEHFREEQKRLAEEHAALKAEQQRLADVQHKMMEHSIPASDSIERVQSDVEELRCYLLDEADSRRSLIKGRRASLSPLSQSQSRL